MRYIVGKAGIGGDIRGFGSGRMGNWTGYFMYVDIAEIVMVGEGSHFKGIDDGIVDASLVAMLGFGRLAV